MLTIGQGDYFTRVARGVLAYARGRPGWTLSLTIWAYADPVVMAAAIGPDGVIGDLRDRAWARGLRKLGLPVVNVGHAIPLPTVPRVGPDETAAGALAAEHLWDTGLRDFAVFGAGRELFARERERGFVAAVRARGGRVHTGAGARPAGRGRPTDDDCDWVRSLPTPIGVFACSDFTALRLTQACRAAAVRIPEDVAVVSMDNDALFCESANPPLSSVDNPGERIGFAAAELLDGLMTKTGGGPGSRGRLGRGVAAVVEPVLVRPPFVVTRRSSDVVAVGDPEVAAAVRFIRENAHRPLGVAAVVRARNVSRRWLERRFRELLGRSPLQEVRRARIERVKDLLRSTDLPIAQVAARCGFASAANLSAMFRKEAGTTPARFRAGAG